MATKKGLGRGLEDLLETHDTDLPFLSNYGMADSQPAPGLPPSAKNDAPQELFQALVRLLKSEKVKLDVNETEAHCGEWLKIEIVKEGVSVTFNCANLPLVPSDLMLPGMMLGNLSDCRTSASVVLTSWGVSSQRLLSRVNEHMRYLNTKK